MLIIVRVRNLQKCQLISCNFKVIINQEWQINEFKCLMNEEITVIDIICG